MPWYAFGVAVKKISKHAAFVSAGASTSQLMGRAMKLDLKQTDAGVELPVKALAGSRRNEIRGVVNGMLKVSVTAVAEKGKANQAIIKLLAKELGIAKSRIELISGPTSSAKKFLVSGAQSFTLEEQLRQWLDE
jgi:uncharacterized protein (TIGR00251 family)